MVKQVNQRNVKIHFWNVTNTDQAAMLQNFKKCALKHVEHAQKIYSVPAVQVGFLKKSRRNFRQKFCQKIAENFADRKIRKPIKDGLICKDKYAFCQHISKQQCNENDSIKQSCRKSCNLCDKDIGIQCKFLYFHWLLSTRLSPDKLTNDFQ